MIRPCHGPRAVEQHGFRTGDESFRGADEPLRFIVNGSLLPDESSLRRVEATPDGFRICETRPIRLRDMDGTPTMKAAAAVALAILALGGTFGPALADTDATVATPASPQPELPRFVPSAEPTARRAMSSGLLPR